MKKYNKKCVNCNMIKIREESEGTTKEDYNEYLLKVNKKINEN